MKLFYQKYGKGEPLIILHGLYGSSDNWVSIARKLESYFSVYLLDQRNHGRSPHSDLHNYNVMAEDLNEFMIDENIDKANILGHSMGGKTAMFFAQKYPEKINKLIVADISPFAYSEEFGKTHEFIISSLLSLNLSKFQSRNEIDEELSKSLKQKSLRNFLLKNVKRADDNTFQWMLNLKSIQQNLSNILSGLEIEKCKAADVETLFIKGEKSPYIQIEELDKIKIIFPKSKLITIKAAGHWLHAEQSEEVVRLIIKFL